MTLPSDVPGLVLWQVADDIAQADASAVSAWAGQPPVAAGFTQATAANQPTYRTNVLNGHAAVRFDGVNDVLVGAAGLLGILNGKLGATIFVVNSDPKTNAAAFRELIYIATPTAVSARVRMTHDGSHTAYVAGRRLDADGIAQSSSSPVFDTAAHIECATVDFANTDILLHRDGTLVGSNLGFSTAGSFSATNSTYVTLGAGDTAGAEAFVGDQYEVIVYDRPLDLTERGQIDSYLSDRYAITVSDYVAPAVPPSNRLNFAGMLNVRGG